MIHFHLVTLFPEICLPYLNSSVVGRAVEKGLIKIDFYNPKDFSSKTGERVDARPYGGGPGMVLKPEPVIRAIARAKGRKSKVAVIYFSPSGDSYTNGQAEELAASYKHLILVAGRYEGIDARVKEVFPGFEYSVGSFVLTGGELPALAVADSVARRVPGVLGDFMSLEEKRVASRSVYTRPASFKYKGETYEVPDVLSSGHHQDIDHWRGQN